MSYRSWGEPLPPGHLRLLQQGDVVRQTILPAPPNRAFDVFGDLVAGGIFGENDTNGQQENELWNFQTPKDRYWYLASVQIDGVAAAGATIQANDFEIDGTRIDAGWITLGPGLWTVWGPHYKDGLLTPLTPDMCIPIVKAFTMKVNTTNAAANPSFWKANIWVWEAWKAIVTIAEPVAQGKVEWG